MAILGIFGVIFAICLPIAIVIMIIIAAINHDKGTLTSKIFEKAVRTVYVYVITITTLCMIIAGSIAAVSSLLDFFIPDSDVTGRENAGSSPSIYYEDGYYDYSQDPDYIASQVRDEKNAGIVGFASSATLVAVSLPLFIYHSKQARKLRSEKK